MNQTEGLPLKETSTLTKKILLFAISLGYFMVLLDTTIVNIALPHIHSDLGGGMSGLQWVVNAYTIIFAGLLLSMGSIADRWGAKRIYLWGLIIFVIASALSIFAPSLPTLIGLRALLGVGGAALFPASLSLLSHIFSDPKERAKALAVSASVSGIALAIGPVFGGILVDSFGWPSIFMINIPVGLVSFVITYYLINLPETPNSSKGFDLGGQITAILAILALSFALVEGESYGWNSLIIIGAFIIFIICIVSFLFLEINGKHPLLPLDLFQNTTISAGMGAGLLVNIGFSAILFALPIFFQQANHVSAFVAGTYLLPMTIAMAFNPILTGKIVSKIGPRIPMVIGFTLACFGTLSTMQFGVHSSYLWTGISLFMIGIGISLTIPSLMTAVITSTKKEQTGIASGGLNSIRQIGAVLGVAIVGLFGNHSVVSGIHYLLLTICIAFIIGAILSFIFIDKN